MYSARNRFLATVFIDMDNPYVESSWAGQDEQFETTLRPQSLSEFIGQEQIRERLDIFLSAAKERKEPLGHSLFYGPPGLGKTTLASILSKVMGTNLVVTSGPVIEKAGDLAGILTNLQEGDFLFIDEIHRLNRNVEEYLYPAMEDFSLDLVIDSGPSARSVKVNLNRFTLVGATTRVGLISSPMRSRFGFICRLDYYEPQVLKKIVIRSAQILKIAIDDDAAMVVAARARGTPRIVNNLLRFVRDYAQVQKQSKIDRKSAEKALELLSIDNRGLDEMDKKILSLIIEHHQGGPVGLNTLAVAIGEEPITLSDVYEPYLIMQGFLRRTPRGREATDLAYTHLGYPLKSNHGDPS